jgi:hypothetical protein
MTTRISALWTRLRLPSKMKTHNVLHINILLYRETTARVMHHALPFSMMTRLPGVQVQIWTRLGLLSTVKIHNFFHIHLLVPYRVTEAYATPHSRPPPVITHLSMFGTLSRRWQRCVFMGMIARSNFTQRAQKTLLSNDFRCVVRRRAVTYSNCCTIIHRFRILVVGKVCIIMYHPGRRRK